MLEYYQSIFRRIIQIHVQMMATWLNFDEKLTKNDLEVWTCEAQHQCELTSLEIRFEADKILQNVSEKYPARAWTIIMNQSKTLLWN